MINHLCRLKAENCSNGNCSGSRISGQSRYSYLQTGKDIHFLPFRQVHIIVRQWLMRWNAIILSISCNSICNGGMFSYWEVHYLLEKLCSLHIMSLKVATIWTHNSILDEYYIFFVNMRNSLLLLTTMVLRKAMNFIVSSVFDTHSVILRFYYTIALHGEDFDLHLFTTKDSLHLRILSSLERLFGLTSKSVYTDSFHKL